METTKVYRLVHTTLGCGPWNTHVHEKYGSLPDDIRHAAHRARQALNDCFWDNEAYAMKHPPAGADIPNFTFQHICATDCLNKLRDWFCVSDDIMNKLFDAGFTVMEYTVPKREVLWSESGMQVGIDPDDIIESNDLTMLALLD